MCLCACVCATNTLVCMGVWHTRCHPRRRLQVRVHTCVCVRNCSCVCLYPRVFFVLENCCKAFCWCPRVRRQEIIVGVGQKNGEMRDKTKVVCIVSFLFVLRHSCKCVYAHNCKMYCKLRCCFTTLHHVAAHCNTLQHSAIHRIVPSSTTATHCSPLQHTATHCNAPQHTATHRNTLQHIIIHQDILQHTATHHNTLH